MKSNGRNVIEGECFGLVADQPNGKFRQAAPKGVSCRHAWRPDVDIDEATGVELSRADKEVCVGCSATCRRDANGKIVEYETEESRRLAYEIHNRRAVA